MRSSLSSVLFLIVCLSMTGHCLERRGISRRIIDPYGLLDRDSSGNDVITPRRLGKESAPFPHDSFLGTLSDWVSPPAAKGEGGSAPGSRQATNPSFLRSIMSTVGIDVAQLGLMVVNMLVYVAELITNTLIGEEVSARAIGSLLPSLLSTLVEGQPQEFSNLRQNSLDPALPRLIIQSLDEKTGNTTACLQQLICKASPLIWSLQEINDGKYNSKEQEIDGGVESYIPYMSSFKMFFKKLPKLKDFWSFSNTCEVEFPFCQFMHFT